MRGVHERVHKHRKKLRKEGMRPIQIWVPDTSLSGFAEECKRQSQQVEHDPQEKELLEFLDEASDHEGWE
ncbi:MAG: antitoxin MazE family protein [Chlorobium phaeobacteroides]|uniref:Antitoxin MazE n=1 Tax=Chlorobium phaeobacteroides (strain BS1) TaxID=331678 RepID=B3EKD8_CHLPB|nr:antitoxin MazE family protein [Chlorobium phaeobacteroides]